MGRYVRLRSARRGGGSYAFCVTSSGYVNLWYAIYAFRCAPDWTAARPQKPLHSRGRAKTAVQGAECHVCPLADEQYQPDVATLRGVDRYHPADPCEES
jgi:hypothetical protein